MPVREESMEPTKVKMVLVPQADLDKLEVARLALYELLKPQMKNKNVQKSDDFHFLCALQEITQPMWYAANRKYPEMVDK